MVGGIASGAFGLGGGAIFNPVLLYLGQLPKVVSATAMYMIMFSTLSSSVVYILLGTLNIYYGIWVSLWCVLGTLIGLNILEKIMAKYKRQSPIVFILAFLLGIAAIAVPTFGGMDIKEQYDEGIDIFKFKDFC